MVNEIKVHENKDGDKFYHLPSETRKFFDKYKFIAGILHRKDGPAREWADGSKQWFINGKMHREDGPAIEYADGSKEWWVNGKSHRSDGPAIECPDGFKSWWVNGKSHRLDGPAIECPDGSKYWYINDKELSYEEWFEWVMKYSSKENQINVLLKMNQW